MQIKVRAACLEDAEALARLSRELGYPATAKIMRDRLKRLLGVDDQRVVVAEDSEGKVSGWLHAHSSVALESGHRVEILGLVVSEKARRQGLGRSLVAQAEIWAAEISAEALVVRSSSTRVESHSFYPSLGYLPSKTQVVYRKRVSI